MATGQAEVFGRYLLKSSPKQDCVELFETAMRANPGNADAADKKLLRLIQKYPALLAPIDAGLALVKPHSEVRRRIYVMFSILEASPYYHEYFLPKRHSPWFLAVVVLVGIRGMLRAIAGIFIIKVAAR